MSLTVHMTSDDLKALNRALRKEEDGKQLRKDLRTNMRAVLEPVRDQAREAVKAMPSHGHAGPNLRAAVARKTVVEVRLAGRFTGVRVLTRKTPNLRAFRSAPRHINAGKWRHPVYGNRNKWVTQKSGAKNWFDGTVRKHMPKYSRAVQAALDDVAKRIARK